MMESYAFGPRLTDRGVRFRLWAPGVESAQVEVEGLATAPLRPIGDGWLEAVLPCGHGARYRFRLTDGLAVPDPASRYQPEGAHGPSQVTDPAAWRWRNEGWKGRRWEETVLYEVHAGLMGGFAGVAAALPALKEIGVTAIELMPIGAFSGNRNWGYDGVLPFAPAAAYGAPDDLKSLVDQAHGLGLMVFLDVVYNHFGPDGNYLPVYAPAFFRNDIATPWGAAIDFRRPQVRQFFIENALYWLDEFRIDGLRLDAIHQISDPSWIGEMAAAVRDAFPDRHIHLVVENERNAVEPLRQGIDAQWNDDFHNVMHVLLTGETNAYYEDFADRPTEKLVRALSEGFIYQGQPSIHQNGKRRGTPSRDLRPAAFVNFLQNHDQIGNRALGERLTSLVAPDRLRAAIPLVLLCPHIPLIFMGEESGSTAPFLFFTDFHDQLADAVREGRRREFARFPAFADPESRSAIPDPNAPETFDRSRIGPDGADAEAWRMLYRNLLRLRHDRIVPGLSGAVSLGAVAIGDKAVLARWRLGDGSILTIACNLGDTLAIAHFPESEAAWGALDAGKAAPASTIVWIDAP